MFKILKPVYIGSLENSHHGMVNHLNRITQVTTKMAKNEVNELRLERLACTANPLALVAQQQPVYHPQNHHTHDTHNSSTRSQQYATRNRGKAIVNSHPLTYDQEPEMVAEDDALLKENKIDKLVALISLSFKKIYKPTTTLELHQTPRAVNVAGARENVDQELEAHYLYMAPIQEVTPDAADNSGPIFDVEPLQKVQNYNDNYNVFANDNC
ncbi:hypothetical protein Tco_0461386 [Tanacetum coccineum]